MARARLRADQIRDPDVLTEAEHLALVHQNLTTSGTLTVSGTQGAITLTTNGVQLLVNGTAISGSGTGESNLPMAFINGLILSNGTDSDHDIDITTGKARSEDDTIDIALTSGITKQIDATWAVGTNQGGLFTSSVSSDTTYHVFLIKNPTSGSVDVGFDTNLNASNRPAAYTKYRRIGSLYTDGSANLVQFNQMADEFLLSVIVNDEVNTDPGTDAVYSTLSVPIGIKVFAKIRIRLTENTVETTRRFLATSPDQDDIIPSGPLGDMVLTGSYIRAESSRNLRTNTSGQIRYRLDSSGEDLTVAINTHGWIDLRGKQ